MLILTINIITLKDGNITVNSFTVNEKSNYQK